MAAGSDARFVAAREVTYGTRVAPTRAISYLTGESISYQYARAFSNALGAGMWQRPSVLTTQAGSGSLNGEIPSTGFGFLLDLLHGNTVTPTQQGATTAYIQTHVLNTPPTKSLSLQKQIPPVLTSTLLPNDFTGLMLNGITFSWDAQGLATFECGAIVQGADTAQASATYSAPASWQPFSFLNGSMTIAGALEANILGSGSLAFAYALRDDAYAFGSSGRIAKPVQTAKPTASGSFTADFNDLVNVNRVVNNTTSDVVLKFESTTIASTYKYKIEITIPDCVFSTPFPNVDDPGPVQQAVSFAAASQSGNAPSIQYQSTDVTL